MGKRHSGVVLHVSVRPYFLVGGSTLNTFMQHDWWNCSYQTQNIIRSVLTIMNNNYNTVGASEYTDKYCIFQMSIQIRGEDSATHQGRNC